VPVEDHQRHKFIQLHIEEGVRIKIAAEMAGVKYENAKQIKKVYLREGRKKKKLYPDYNFDGKKESKNPNTESSNGSVEQVGGSTAKVNFRKSILGKRKSSI